MRMVTAKQSTGPRWGYFQELEPDSSSWIQLDPLPSSSVIFSQLQVTEQLTEERSQKRRLLVL